MSSRSSVSGAAAPKGTAASRRYRLVLWAYTALLLGGIAGFVVIQRGTVSRDLRVFALIAMVGGAIGAVVTFRGGTAASKAERDLQERQTMLLIMATELGKQDDAALERISRQRGMAGEAATWILDERRRKRDAARTPHDRDGV